MNSRLVFIFLLLAVFDLKAQSVGGTTSGSASYCPGNNSGFISLTGYTGSILHWESSTDNINWTNLGNPTSTQSYLNLVQTTYYRAIVQDGVFPPDTSTVSTITIFDAAAGGSISGGGTFCMEATNGSLTISGETGNVLYWQYSTNNGSSWTQIANTTTTLNYTTITQNTIYNAVVQNEPTCPNDTSDFAYFYFDSLSVSGTISSTDTVACSDGNNGVLSLSGEYGAITDWIISEDMGASWTSSGITSANMNFNDLITTTSYQVIVQNGVCPADTSNLLTVFVYVPEIVSAGQDETIENHASVTLNGSGNGNVVWSPADGLDDPYSLSPTATPIETTVYTITLTDSHGCSSIDSVLITVNFPIPTAITPNNDGVNDYFLIDNIENLPNNSIVIYNRQGNVVYKKSPYDNTWNGKSLNGKDLSDGIYYYLLDFGDGTDVINGYVLIKR